MNTVIIVPTDFSLAAINASEYAAELALATHAKIILVHIWHYPINMEVPVTAEVINQLQESAAKNIAQCKQDLLFKTNGKIEITTEVREGFFIDELGAMYGEQPEALIVMGAHVTNTAERVIFGSSILSAVRNLAAPLIIVPNGTKFTGIKIAGIACDLQNAQHTINISGLKRLFNELHPQIYIVHVSNRDQPGMNEQELQAMIWLKQSLESFNPSFHLIQDENVGNAVMEFSQRNKLDLLIIIPKKHGFFNRLLHKSQSKQMIINTHIPILSIHE